MLGRADEARKYAQLSLEYTREGEAFYRGYAYEALARAETVAGNRKQAEGYLEESRRLAESVQDPEERKRILDDLERKVTKG